MNTRQAIDLFQMQLDTNAGCAHVAAGFRPELQLALKTDQAAKVGPNKVDTANRCVNGVANVLSISRTGIKIHLDGMDLEAYHQNPVVLAGHSQIADNLMPGAIGTIEKVTRTNNQTELRFRNMHFDEDPLSDAWYQKVLNGTVRMTSVGFVVLEWEVAVEVVGSGKDKKERVYIDIPRSELLEISVVPIGANRGALFGQLPHYLLNRIAAAEQRATELQQAIRDYLTHEQATVAASAKDRLLTALQQL